MTPRLRSLALTALAASCGAQEEAPSPYDWREDDRLRVILHTSSPKGHFDRDTSDMYPVMVEKLATGRPAVQNHYRGELAAGGDRVVTLIEDLIQRYGSTQNGSLVIGNCLGVLGLSDAPSAVRVPRMMLGHPAESVRSAAIRAMAKLAMPEDYDSLEGLMPLVSGEVRRALVQAMGASDPPRLARDLSGWLSQGQDLGLLVLAGRAVCEAGAGAELDPMCLGHEISSHPNLQPFLVAALAAEGDATALTQLGLLLRDESQLVRTRALEAASMCGLQLELLPVASEDPSETLRVLAIEALAGLQGDARVVGALRASTRDESVSVRQAGLRALLSSGDGSARAVFLEMLTGGPSELEPALRAIRGLWTSLPGLPEAASDSLIGTLDGMAERPLKEREPWIQALGQVPHESAGRWLLQLAMTATGDRHHMTAHRWLCLQVSNSGGQGRGLLIERWREESDPERSMDYLWAASMSREEGAVQFLIDVSLSAEAPDHQRLFAAECLTRRGQTPRVAPILKRACLRVKDPLVRPAFEELLWLWYS